jgi:hypothetical protein
MNLRAWGGCRCEDLCRTDDFITSELSKTGAIEDKKCHAKTTMTIVAYYESIIVADRRCVYLQLDLKKARVEGKQCHAKTMKSKRS